MKRFNLVRQEQAMGCGIACIASLLGITYWEAVERWGRCDCQRGFDRKEMAQILAAIGHPARRIPPTAATVESLPVGTIVFLSYTRGWYRRFGHYLLRTKQGWMDPWGNRSRRVQRARACYRPLLPQDAPVASALVPVAWSARSDDDG